MKKSIIIAAVILSSALTALAITSSSEKTAAAKLKIEKSDFANKTSNVANDGLATAD